MKPVRLPISNIAEGTDTKSVGASPKFFSNMFSGGRHRPSLSGEPLGCLSLLDAGEQIERPRAFPSPGLAGEILPSCSLKVHAQPTIQIQRPRAILSSPENDELLQGQQVETLTTSSSKINAVRACLKDLPSAPVSAAELIEPLPPSKDVPKAVVSPPDELLYMGDIETSISDEASICSTSSNVELHSNDLLLAHELLDIKLGRTITAEAVKEKFFLAGSPQQKSKHEQNGNEENLGNGAAANRVLKKHSGKPSVTPPRPPKQQSSSPLARKGNSVRVLRPWY